MASAPIIGMEPDPLESLNRQQRRAIAEAVRARSEGRMAAYSVAMAEVDRLAEARIRLRATLSRAYA